MRVLFLVLCSVVFVSQVRGEGSDRKPGFQVGDPIGIELPIDPVITPPITRGDPRTNPTAGVGSLRPLPEGRNDRKLSDSTAMGARPVPFPTNTITLPSCSDPAAVNFGQMGTCVYTVPPPPPSCPAQPAAENRSVSCPVPLTGLVFERRTYSSAPAPTCWIVGAWTQTGNTCSTPSSCGSQPADETRSLSCPSGQVGSITEARSFSAAPAPTCWVAEPWAEILRTCAATCSGVPQPASEIRTLSCLSGQVGLITESRSYAAAPAPTCWAPGPWTQTASTCAFPCGPRPPDETQTLSCPAGFVGTGIVQTRTFTATGGPTCWDPTPWTTVENNCRPGLGPDLGCGPGRPAPSFRWDIQEVWAMPDDCTGRIGNGNGQTWEQSFAPYNGTSCEGQGEGSVTPIGTGCISNDRTAEYQAMCMKICN